MNEINESVIVDTEAELAADTEAVEPVTEITDEPGEAVEAAENSPSEPDEIRALRSELDELKLQLDQSRAMYDRLHAECMEFSQLYPDVPLSTVPDNIWASARAGIPLAAAYALSERKESMARAKAMDINSKNNERSSGALSSAKTEEFFSPAEVRAMSAAEVRANYAKIITSMSKWH